MALATDGLPLTVDARGNVALDTSGTGAPSDARDLLSAWQDALSADPPNYEALGGAITDTVGTLALALGASSAALGPFSLLAGALFGGVEALASLDPATPGTGGFYDRSGTWHQAPSSATSLAAWSSWALSNGITAEALGYAPGWYTEPGSAGWLHETEDVGNGPAPSYAPGSFEETAEKLLLADWRAWCVPQNVIRGGYNYARWPLILYAAAHAWNAGHSSAGTASSSFMGLVTDPGSGGTRELKTVAVPPQDFGGTPQPGLVGSNKTAIGYALWLTQFGAQDWRDGAWDDPTRARIPAGHTLSVTLNNGPPIPKATGTRTTLSSILAARSKGTPPMQVFVTPPASLLASLSQSAGLSPPSTAITLATPGAPTAPESAAHWWQRQLFTLPTASKTPVTLGEAGVVAALAAVVLRWKKVL